MKKLLLFAMIFLFVFGQIFAQTHIQVNSGKTRLELTQNSREGFSVKNTIASFGVQLENMFTNGEYVILSLDGYGPSYNIGNPDLPVLNRLIEVPLGATVQVNVISYDETVFNLADYDINMQLFPSQESVSKSADPSTIVLQKNLNTYSTNKWFSNPIARFHEEGTMRGVRIGRLEISPFEYNPVSGEIKVINNLKVEVKFVKGDFSKTDKVRKQYYSPAFEGLFTGFLNYTPSRDGLTLNSIPMHFVIISHRMFEQTLAPFIAWKKKQGFLLTVKYTDEPEVGNTTTSIKNYLQGLYVNASPSAPAPAFIAIVGDIAQVPTFVGMAPPNTPHPTDLYYTTYDGPNDIIPDVFIGRMSAETTAHLEAILYKTLLYEKLEMEDPSYLARTITIAGYDGGSYPALQGNGAINYMKHYLNAAHGIDPFEMYHPCSGQGATVISKINQGVSLGVYSAHCGQTEWSNPNVTTSHVSNMTNSQKWGLLIGNCCLSAKFDHSSPCFGEAVIRAVDKGGVGYIGGSESTYWSEDYWWVTGYGTVSANPQIANFGVGSFDALFHENGEPAEKRIISGSQFNVAGCLAVNESNTSMKKYYWEIYHFLGDPTLMPYMGQMPPMNPTYMETMPLGLSTLSITNLAPECYVALTDNGELKAAGFADNTGFIELVFEPFTIPTTADLVATTTFHAPFFGTVEIIPAEGPYVVYHGYTSEEDLTYISTNSEIEVTLKNVGVEQTGTLLNVTITCDDPQLTIENGTAQIGSLNPDETATATFKVTVAHDIPDNKSFAVDVTVTDEGKTSWNSKMSLVAYAPKFKLEKVLLNNSENGNLEAGSVTTITTIVTNSGHADAYGVKGNIVINSEYVTLACEEKNRAGQNLPVGETIELDFVVVTSPEMPYGHEADIDLLLTAQYDLSASDDFTVTCSGSDSYCMPGNTNCSGFNDRIISLQIIRTNDGEVLLEQNPTCTPTIGYTDYTNISLNFEPGLYTIKVSTGYQSHRVKGWIDLNGNNTFESNEVLFVVPCAAANTIYSANFTIPQDFTPGTHRFRIRTRDGSNEPEACDTYSYGQTLDYSAVLPELYARPQNVVAVLDEETITTTWEAPEEGTPEGYNIYRNNIKLNDELLTETTFTEEDIAERVYVYHVTAVYESNKESYSSMSNVICNILPPDPEFCEPPVNLQGDTIGNIAIITWDEPENIDGILLGYNIYRDEAETPLNEELLTEKEYRDEELEDGTYQYNVETVYEHCISEMSESVIVTINTVGIHELQTASYELYPNPTNGNVTIEGKGLNRVEIYDVQGRKLVEYNSVTDNLQINVNKYENGIYFVKLYSEKNMTVTKRLVIIK